MSGIPFLLVLWCSALSRAPVSGAAPESLVNKTRSSLTITEQNATVTGRTTETQEEEIENQENILTQLLGDYDKVKTLAEGSDCRCKCVVRPLSRSACQRIEEGDAQAEDFYTVETITVGPNCKKCACIAPPSALNPCEGDYRFKKLQQAGKDDVKLSAIMDLLEGALYGQDLLKLHSVTSKLLSRVNNIEKLISQNRTERVSVKLRSEEEKEKKEKKKEEKKEKERRVQQRLDKRKRLDDLERSLKKDTAAVYSTSEKKYEENVVGGQGSNRTVLKMSQSRNRSEHSMKSDGAGPSSSVIRGVTFYKAEPEKEGGAEETGMNTLSDSRDLTDPTKPRPGPKTGAKTGAKTGGKTGGKVGTKTGAGAEAGAGAETTVTTHTQADPETSVPSTTPRTTTTIKPTTTTIKPTTTTIKSTTTTTKPTTTTIKPTTTTIKPTTTTTKPTTTTTKPTTTTIKPTTTTTTPTPSTTTLPSQVEPVGPDQPPSPTPERPRSRTRLSWTESPADASITTARDPGLCKDTLASISEPTTVNTFGRPQGAWMKDSKGNGQVIYVTNYHYGNNLLEFRDLATFQSGQPSNSYKLPYSWMGTGHIVHHGSFYYNRAFSRDVIRFSLRGRYVAAWTTLQDAVLMEAEPGDATIPWRGEGQSEIELAVDEGGVWLLYPALDLEGFHQEVIMLSRLNARDLRPEATFRTGLRRRYYGNTFLICGVLYAVDSYDRAHANVSYAFDTHTHTQMVPRLPFTSNYSLTSQLDYNPLDRKLYAWDNGHQVNYDIIFAY